MIIDNNFFKDTHLFFKHVSKKFILPNIGKLNQKDVSDKPDFSKVTKFDLLVEKELVEYFNKWNFINIISEEHSSSLLKENNYQKINNFFQSCMLSQEKLYKAIHSLSKIQKNKTLNTT